MGAIIWLLLGQSVNYFFVLGVLLVSSIAGVIVHIPAGIGVLEAVFIALLAGSIPPKAQLSPPCSLTVCCITLSTAAGADLLPVAGKPGEEATGEK